MTNYNKLAAEIKKRDNKISIGICTAEVISHVPVTLRIYYAGEPVDFKKFFDVKGLINGGRSTTTGDLYVEEYPVEIGDKFICMAGNDNQSLWVLGKYEYIENLNIYLEEGE